MIDCSIALEKKLLFSEYLLSEIHNFTLSSTNVGTSWYSEFTSSLVKSWHAYQKQITFASQLNLIFLI